MRHTAITANTADKRQFIAEMRVSTCGASNDCAITVSTAATARVGRRSVTVMIMKRIKGANRIMEGTAQSTRTMRNPVVDVADEKESPSDNNPNPRTIRKGNW